MNCPSFSFESQFQSHPVAGVDEVGYGAWSGPVVVAAVVCHPEHMPRTFLEKVRDSKKMTHSQRLDVFQAFICCPEMGHSIVLHVPVQDINHGCVLKLTLGAMAYAAEKTLARSILVDGCHPIPLERPQKSIIKGDEKSVSIALASIIAKVVRDREMTRLSVNHPCFHWDQNKGYGTQIHRLAIQKFGLTPHHRIQYCRRVL